MPAQTRAGGQPQASKVHKAKASEPKQQHFPPRRRQVKTYGRPTSARRLDQTLTQMNFVSSTAQEELEILNSSNDEAQEDGEQEANENDEELVKLPVKPEKAIKKKLSQPSSRSNRRRTMGDEEPEQGQEKSRSSKRRRTLGDHPSASSSFHTQTLTQFLSVHSKDEDEWKIPDSDGEEDLGLIKETPRKNKGKSLEAHATQSIISESVTPSHRLTKVEIPSSQSPATPLLLRYSPAKEPSPLKSKSLHASASRSTRKSTSKIPRTLIIEDSYTTTQSSPVTPTPKAKASAASQKTVTPAKKLRFNLPEDKENITPGRTKPKSPKPVLPRTTQRQPLSEVPDSDDEFDDTENEDTSASLSSAASPSRVVRARHEAAEIIIPTDEDEEGADANYEAGAETQAVLVSSECTSSLKHDARNSPGIFSDDDIVPHEDSENQQPAPSSPTVQSVDDEIVEQTPTATPSRDQRVQDAAVEHIEECTQGFTQGMESQRVPLEAIKATGPISDRSDITISIYSEHVKNMVARTKTHEFRSYKLPQAHRVWIYVPKPISELRYMCIFGPAKTPGEIHENGIGNADFNRGMKRSKFAYEVLHMYELNNPVSLEEIKRNGWPAPPQKFTYVPPALVGQLTSNLRCAVWGEEAEQGVIHSSHNVTESQELANQIRSDIVHATQHESSDHIEAIPSSQLPPQPRSTGKRATPAHENVFARPALPKTMSASSSRSLPPMTQSQMSRSGGVRPSQATTISQLSSSSPTRSPGKPLPLPDSVGRRSAPNRLSDTGSPTAHRQSHHSLRSSQFPTKSQMLPDSLLDNDIQEPPAIIWDSADESD